ncbi:MAG: hypothetical protein ACI3YB_07960 [Prevotella sp.]
MVINNVGSDGTDIFVKAMVNIMLINVFKKKAAHKSGDFIVHCLGKGRSCFLIPRDIETRLKQGSSKRYDDQYLRFKNLRSDVDELQQLIDLIHRERKGYDQEGYIHNPFL